MAHEQRTSAAGHHPHDAHHLRDTRDTQHNHDHSHGHGHNTGALPRDGARWRYRLAHRLVPHSHDTANRVDPIVETSAEGIRTLWISLAVLGATAALQMVIVTLSGSVALLGDTIHNAADALTALPLGVAFVLGRRPATRRYTYGYGRAEDLAGVAVLATIAASAGLAAYEAVDRLLHPRAVTHLPAVAAAGLVGFAGNELVARYRIRTGRKIGSAALVADGLHARTDGFTSLAVLLGAAGVAAGWDTADPVIGLAITVTIIAVLRDAAGGVYRRLMDAVDPNLIDAAEAALRATPGVSAVGRVRLRWIGHRLHAEADIVVPGELTVVDAHAIAVTAEHALIHAVPRLAAATVHTDHPAAHDADHPHALLAHHGVRAHPLAGNAGP
ncbi:cation diffusion facilitator family transporter [Protofrankia symbiont of Coriaria ruscifolia]|uniref:cation diffusion facilitator family transporter n=1 Tax=Protofrankia symbiont of Coriaria ruscifolia TaxID=1306542 RepID=UPI001040EC68|nr:cation diffusion facilitator family transporter [Protofrankia symbiont of Coriaria ruscifolia]